MPSLPRLPFTSSCTRLDTQIPPASANASSRAATLIPSPWMLALDNIADVDPHPEFDPPICWNLCIPLGHCALDLHGTPQGFHRTDEQDQQAIAGCPCDPTTMFFDLGFNELSMVSVELGESAFIDHRRSRCGLVR